MAIIYGTDGDETLTGTDEVDAIFGWAEGGSPATDLGRTRTS